VLSITSVVPAQISMHALEPAGLPGRFTLHRLAPSVLWPGPVDATRTEDLDGTGLQMHQVGPGSSAFADDLARVADDEITARVDGDRPAAPELRRALRRTTSP
jgi:hypothetical protein